MTADDAFDKLMDKNALNIPVARPSADTRSGKTLESADAIPAAGRAQPKEAMRVMDILDDAEAGDYRPRGDDEEPGSYTRPTETDLEPVDSDIDRAYAKGAQVLGETVGEEDFFGDIGEEREARVVTGGDTVIDLNPNPASSALDKARRLRRFAYLPLAGMEKFDSQARDIMASLTSATPDKPSLAVTSAGRGSGQAELAIRLALATAKRVDYRVLLIDFDVRKPQVAKRLGLSSKYFTLADVLRESCPLGEALMMSEEDNLYVLPARAVDRDGDEVLNDRQVQALMARVHDLFNFVVVSCGPLDHADATIVCRHAGATALAAYCGHSRAGNVRAAAEQLSEAGVTVAGLLLAGTE